MKSMLRNILDHGVTYQALMFVCPGCASIFNNDGLHMLPVNTEEHKPAWTFDGNLEKPTVSPSIMTQGNTKDGSYVCHSHLVGGVFDFLNDSTHGLVGQKVNLPDLPEWVLREEKQMPEEIVTETTTETVTETQEVPNVDTAAADSAGITGTPGKDLSDVADAANAQTLANASPANTGSAPADGTRYAAPTTDASTAGTAEDASTAGTAEDASTAGTAEDASTAGTAEDASTAGTAEDASTAEPPN